MRRYLEGEDEGDGHGRRIDARYSKTSKDKVIGFHVLRGKGYYKALELDLMNDYYDCLRGVMPSRCPEFTDAGEIKEVMLALIRICKSQVVDFG